MTKQEAFENRLAFITHHRDSLEELPGLMLFHSSFHYFKTAFLFDKIAIGNVPPGFTLHNVDWSGIDGEFLLQNNWEYAESMTYMVLGADQPPVTMANSLTIKKAVAPVEVETFCQIQSMGFSNKDYRDDEWYPILLASAKKAQQTGSHSYYIGYINGKPVGAALAFYHKNIVGIYSVTTLTPYRKKGVSSGLMHAVINDARQSNCKRITLQVMTGSYAQGFYENLGFEALFECGMYKKEVS